jgi:hypothetical protein
MTNNPAEINEDALERARELGARESGLVVVVTSRPDGSASASVVNAGVHMHPATGERVVGFVARGYARKIANMRMQRRVTVVFRSGWDWVAVEGDAELVGPDDLPEGIESDDLPRLLREVYAAAVGGNADDWGALDEVFTAERHTAVLIRPVRIYSNPTV